MHRHRRALSAARPRKWLFDSVCCDLARNEQAFPRADPRNESRVTCFIQEPVELSATLAQKSLSSSGVCHQCLRGFFCSPAAETTSFARMTHMSSGTAGRFCREGAETDLASRADLSSETPFLCHIYSVHRDVALSAPLTAVSAANPQKPFSASVKSIFRISNFSQVSSEDPRVGPSEYAQLPFLNLLCIFMPKTFFNMYAECS